MNIFTYFFFTNCKRNNEIEIELPGAGFTLQIGSVANLSPERVMQEKIIDATVARDNCHYRGRKKAERKKSSSNSSSYHITTRNTRDRSREKEKNLVEGVPTSRGTLTRVLRDLRMCVRDTILRGRTDDNGEGSAPERIFVMYRFTT